MIGGAMLVAVLVIVAVRTAGDGGLGARQSAVRAQAQNALRSVAEAGKVYQQEHGAAAAVDDLLKVGLIEKEMLRGYSRAEPVAGAGGGTTSTGGVGADGADRERVVLVQTAPCRAVRRGEAWGGPGETIAHDLSGCRYVLMSNRTVQEIDEETFQREFAGRVRLVEVE